MLARRVSSMIFSNQRLLQRFLCSKEKNHDQEDASNDESLTPSQRAKSRVFKPQEEKIILDFDEEKYASNVQEELNSDEFPLLYRQRVDRFHDVNLERGKTGVFDLPDLVEILRKENLKDIVVIKVSPELKYCDYMVLASVKSPRHLNAVTEFILKLNKLKKNEDDPFLLVEGKTSNDWRVIDMKDIVLHLFMDQVRQNFDLESLWAIGPEYDDNTQRPQRSALIDLAEKHLEYLQSLETNDSNSQSSSS